MIDLYGMASPNVLKVLLILEELELPYRMHRIDIWSGDQYTPEFKAMNPNSKVPVIVDPDGPEGQPVTVFESGAILLYFAEKHGRFLPTEPRARIATLQWLMLQMGSIGPMFGQANHFRLSAPAGNKYGLSRYMTEVKRLCDVLEVRLSESPYLGGGEYGVADMAAWPWIAYYTKANGVDIDSVPAVKRWADKIKERPATARARADWKEFQTYWMERRVAADEDQVDRLFGRGQYARA